MRYIGNKENILDRIYQILLQNEVKGDTFIDVFSGTTSAAKYFKKRGCQIYSCDLMYLSYCLQKAYIENNKTPMFESLLDLLPSKIQPTLFVTPLEIVLDYLNTIEPIEGFIYKNYTPEGTASLERPRMYFSSENGKKIDAIRTKIEEWYCRGLVTEHEYYILISCLLESVSFYANISGVYAAFQKQWDPRAIKPFRLRLIDLIDNGKENYVYNRNSLELVSLLSTDILYMDPPYNERQYLPNYHLVETIAKYDSPSIRGITGMREYEDKKSSFCNARSALESLDYVAKNANCRFLILSYNSEGIMKQEDILSILSQYGDVKLEQFEYLRFKSNNKGLSKTKKHVFEQLYILKK